MLKSITHTAIAYFALSVLNVCVCALLAFLTAGTQPTVFTVAFLAYWATLGVLRPFRLALAVAASRWMNAG